jgi:hypothetical protein
MPVSGRRIAQIVGLCSPTRLHSEPCAMFWDLDPKQLRGNLLRHWPPGCRHRRIAFTAMGFAGHRPYAWLPADCAAVSAVDYFNSRGWRRASVGARSRKTRASITILATIGFYASAVLTFTWCFRFEA